MKLLIIANCQQGPLWSMMGQAGLDMHRAQRPVHELSVKHAEELLAGISGYDGVILQYNKDKRFVEMGLDPVSMKQRHANVCVIPNIYFAGYHPGFVSLTSHVLRQELHGEYIQKVGLGPYFDCLVLAGFDLGLSSADIVRLLESKSDAMLAREKLDKFIEHSFSELGQREQFCDVVISDWIKENWFSRYLFYSFNHPANAVLQELGTRILRYFGSEVVVPPREKPFLSNYRLPIYDFIRRFLSLDSPPPWPIGGGASDHGMHIARGMYDHIAPTMDFIAELVAGGDDEKLPQIRRHANYGFGMDTLRQLLVNGTIS